MSRTTVPIIVPKSSRATYTGYVLANGVKCVVAQDSNAKVPAAAMSIRAGQLNDPAELPGLAHFCEHMLFMGTEKYPKEDEYDSYISKSGGNNNAWTADTATTYYFSVSDGALNGALERFVEFFVSPLFNESAVAREVKAVHSEDEKNHNVDYWRMHEITRSLLNPKHPKSRYGCGNLTTLWDEPKANGVDLLAGLRQYYSSHYLAEEACIAVCSSHPPEEVLQVIEPALLRMKAGARGSFHFLEDGESFFRDDVRGCWFNVRTIRKARNISIAWAVRSPLALWKSMPGAYISHILGHECDTSVLGVLKKRDLATGMFAGARREDDDFEVFSVTIALTKCGFSRLEEVIALVYHYIGESIENGVDRRVYEGMKAEQQLSFESSEVRSVADQCTAMATTANETGLTHCWIGGEVALEDDLEATAAYIRQLVPSNAVVFLQWGSLPCEASTEVEAEKAIHDGEDDGDDDEESSEGDAEDEGDALFETLPPFAQVRANCQSRFHKAQYAHCAVPADCLSRWTAALSGTHPAELALPAANPFLPTDFTVFPSCSSTPVEEEFRSPHGVTYVRKDAGHHNTFKCAVHWNPLSPVAYSSPLHRLYTRVMHGILEDALTELSYYGELAALSNRLSMNPGGVGVYMEGPHQNLHTFLSSVLQRVLDRTVLQSSAEKYATYYEVSIRALQSMTSQQPYQLAFDRWSKLSRTVLYTFDDILPVASSATYEGYKRFIDDYIREGVLFECFVAGNMPSSKEMAELINESVEALLRTSPIPTPTSIPRFRDVYDLRKRCSVADPDDTGAHARSLTSLDVISFPPFNPDDPNVTVLLDICAGQETVRTRVLCDCALKLLSSSFFNALRTKETLGYVVLSATRRQDQAAHIQFLVQSALDGLDGVYLLSRIVAFLDAVGSQLDQICNAEDVEKVVQGQITAREKLPESVGKDAGMLEVDFAHPEGFAHLKAEVECLKALTPQDVHAFIASTVLNRRTASRGVVIIINSQRTTSADPFLTAGSYTIPLPTQRPSETDEGAAEVASISELVLPSFEGTQSTMDVVAWSSIQAFQQGLTVLPSHTF